MRTPSSEYDGGRVFGSIGVAEICRIHQFEKSVLCPGMWACDSASVRTHMRYAQEPPHEAIIQSANIEHSEIDLAHDFERIHGRNRDVL